MYRLSSLTLGTVGLVLLLGSGPSWAQNAAYGRYALSHVTTGTYNSAFGYNALYSNTTGLNNTAAGYGALYTNTTGGDNTASGDGALYGNTTGNYNTASGTGALQNNATGSYNTASGTYALSISTIGSDNTVSGADAMYGNYSGDGNTASGVDALYHNITGNNNTAIGMDALESNNSGGENAAFGYEAGKANTTGTHNTFIGVSAGTTAGNFTNGTALGFGATLRASNTIVLGNSSITKIVAKVTSITAISDRRLKKDIAPLDPSLGLAFVEKLKPVSYRFRNGDETERYGFIAQDVEQALPASLHGTVETSAPEHGLAMVERGNDKDRTYRMSYGELMAPIVKSIQELRQENVALRHALADQAAANDALRRSIEALRDQVGAVKLTKN